MAMIDSFGQRLWTGVDPIYIIISQEPDIWLLDIYNLRDTLKYFGSVTKFVPGKELYAHGAPSGK